MRTDRDIFTTKLSDQVKAYAYVSVYSTRARTEREREGGRKGGRERDRDVFHVEFNSIK